MWSRCSPDNVVALVCPFVLSRGIRSVINSPRVQHGLAVGESPVKYCRGGIWAHPTRASRWLISPGERRARGGYDDLAWAVSRANGTGVAASRGAINR